MFAAIMTNLEPDADPAPESQWRVEIKIGEGIAARKVMLDLPAFISKADYERSKTKPVFCGRDFLIFFRDRLFMPERQCKSLAEREEALLRAKKIVYDEESELVALRNEVANVEAAIQYRSNGPKRDPIPDDVKLLVWARDGGACVRCGAKVLLHFDHVIPVAKGGGNTADNIQVLCQTCNLKKSDKIAV